MRSNASVLIMGVCCSHILHMTLLTLKTEEFFPALLDQEFFLRVRDVVCPQSGLVLLLFSFGVFRRGRVLRTEENLWNCGNFTLSHCFYFLGHSYLEEDNIFYLKKLENTIVSICAVVQEPTIWPQACLGAWQNVELPCFLMCLVMGTRKFSLVWESS